MVIFKNGSTGMSVLPAIKLIYTGKGSYFPKGQAWQILHHSKSFKNYILQYSLAAEQFKR